MGYIIRYQQGKIPLHTVQHKKRRTTLTGICFLIFLLAVCLYWPEGREYLKAVLIPGDAAVTVAAMEDFSQSLKSGTSLQEGLIVFCVTILEGAGFAAH